MANAKEIHVKNFGYNMQTKVNIIWLGQLGRHVRGEELHYCGFCVTMVASANFQWQKTIFKKLCIFSKPKNEEESESLIIACRSVDRIFFCQKKPKRANHSLHSFFVPKRFCTFLRCSGCFDGYTLRRLS